MFRTLAGPLAALVLALVPPTVARAQTDPEPVQVMILGTWHFDNPGQDIHNVDAAPVTTPGRQAELAAVAQALARFEPTAIGIERMARDQTTLLDHGWPDYAPDDLLVDADERVQVGYRLAALTGVERVYAIDEQPEDGEDLDYFPYGPLMEWAEANGRTDDLEALQAPLAAHVADFNVRQHNATIGALLAEMNDPKQLAAHPAGLGFHYRLLGFGAGRDLPGAVLNARWYERNAKIFAKLMQAARPGDRIVVVFGAGHNDWLRHFVQATPGFTLVESTDYLAGL